MSERPLTLADTGLGTVYERLSVNRLLETLQRRYGFRSALEGPTDGIKGIAGINSLVLGRLGVQVTVQLDREDQAEFSRRIWEEQGGGARVALRVNEQRQLLDYEEGFDLVWSFNSIPQVDDYPEVIRRMKSLARRCLLIMVSNTRNYGFRMHRLHHRFTGEPWHHGNIRAMKKRTLLALAGSDSFRIVETGYVDVPWWPDIDVPYGELLGTFLPMARNRLRDTAHARYYNFGRENLPYFTQEAEMAELYRKHSFIERKAPPFLKALFAHHHYILAERQDHDYGRKTER